METIKFHKLTPINDVDLRIYKEAIDHAFSDDDIKNIAISGQYGSGKSSILESYKKQSNKKIINISLAHFSRQIKEGQESAQKPAENKEAQKPDQKPEDAASVERLLEAKIINQLIHQIAPEEIPLTNFKVKRKPSWIEISKWVVLIFLLLNSLAYFIFSEQWIAIFKGLFRFGDYDYLSLSRQLLWANFISIIASTTFFLYALIKAQKTRGFFRKLRLQGAEVEIAGDSKESYFDKYLNEVLYLFVSSDADAVIFEDFDRFDSHEIFERLREINILVNLHLEKEKNFIFRFVDWLLVELHREKLDQLIIRFVDRLLIKLDLKKMEKLIVRFVDWILVKLHLKKKVIRFVYLLRDDIFTSKERTKFFDFIIPVIPIIDSSNSYQKMLDHLGDHTQKFSGKFLRKFSLYIDDMRLLKNIANEFMVYIETLNDGELDTNKLLAMIAYKNIFPQDFSDLQLRKGFVYSAFLKRDELISCQINDLRENIERLKKEKFLCDTHEDYQNMNNQINYLISVSSNNPYNSNLRNAVAEFSSKNERTYKIKQEKISALDSEIIEHEKNIRLIQSSGKLNNVVHKEDFEKIFSKIKSKTGGDNLFLAIENSDYFGLIKYFLQSGYIDESYSDYMSYFHPGILAKEDKIFLRSILDGKGKQYDWPLKTPKNVIEFLEDSDFIKPEILNNDLLTYLLQNEENFKNPLSSFLSAIKDEGKWDFIPTYFDAENSDKTKFVRALNAHDSATFKRLKNAYGEPDWLKLYSLETLYTTELAELAEINQKNCLCDFISTHQDYLNIEHPDIEKLIAGFKHLKVKFKTLGSNLANPELFERVYQESLYAINFENIANLLRIKYSLIRGSTTDEDIRHKNYTLIMTQPDSPLAIYVNNNIAEYLSVIIENCGEEILDDESAAAAIINHGDLPKEDKAPYVKYLCTPISSLAAIESAHWRKILLSSRKAAYSAENILDYFENDGFDDSLTQFINSSDSSESPLDFSAIDSDASKEKILSKFLNVSVKNEALSNDSYRKLIKAIGWSYPEFAYPDLSDEKLKILIELQTVRMNIESLRFIRETYSETSEFYIQNNPEAYAKLIIENPDDFRFDELIFALDQPIGDSLKIKLLELANDPISVADKAYSPAVIEYILQNKYQSSDFLDLIKRFDDYPEQIQAIIVGLAIPDINHVIEEAEQLSENFIRVLLTNDQLSLEVKIELLAAFLPNIKDQAHCIAYLKILKLAEFEKIFQKGGKPKIEVNETNQALLTAFKEKEFIKDFGCEESAGEGAKKGAAFYKIEKMTLKNNPPPDPLD